MAENSRMAMYEAQAIAIERQMEIDRLTAKNVELTERLRRFEQEKEGGSNEPANKNLDDVWRAINGLTVLVKKLQTQNQADANRLQQKIEKNSQKTWEALAQLRTDVTKFLKPKHNVKDGNTVLLVGGNSPNNTGLILSDDRSKWIEVCFESPYKIWTSGLVHLNEEIYLIGGYKSPRSLYKLDKKLKWIRLADMNIGHTGITNSCLARNGCIWVFGGEDENGRQLKCVERYDPNENVWTWMPDMKNPRSRAAATLWNNGIIIAGGSGNTSVEWFHEENDCWDELPSMPIALYSHSLVSYKNRLILMGDDGSRLRKNAWEFDVENSKWRSLRSMEYPATQFAGAVLDNEIYTIGGCSGECPDLVEIFNGKRWRDGPPLPYSLFDMSHVIIPQEFGDLLCTHK